MGNPPQTPIVLPVQLHEKKLELDSSANDSCDSEAAFSYCSQEIAALLGDDFLTKLPRDVLVAFCLASVEHNHPPAELLYKLIINFMLAYSSQTANEEALKAFDFLDYLTDREG
ncbi:hypothetical protein [Pseudomonas aeruginosa]|uniref:hypothetical protein n=1 Tax=Pseudomonas aeruginosa TaxID=287 RepID=UPI0034E0A553